MENFDPHSLPRRQYGLKLWLKALWLLLALFSLGFALLQLHNFDSGGAAALPLCLFFGGLSVALAAQALRSRITIEGAWIEVRGALRQQAARLDQIEGFRIITSRNSSYTRLCLKSGGGITLPNSFETDDDFRAWFQQVSDLDLRDREAMLRQIEQSAELGSTPEERLLALGRARYWSYALVAAAAAAAAALLLGPESCRLTAAIVLALVPVACFWLLSRSPLTFALMKIKADPRAELMVAVFVASFGLLLGVMELHFVSVKPLLTTILPVAGILFLAFYSYARQNPSKVRAILGMLFIAVVYGYGLAATLDTVADQAPATGFAVPILGKHTTHGRSTTYYLDLAPWGPYAEPRAISVPDHVFEHANPGDMVCLDLYPGRLYASWYRLGTCPAVDGGVEQ